MSLLPPLKSLLRALSLCPLLSSAQRATRFPAPRSGGMFTQSWFPICASSADTRDFVGGFDSGYASIVMHFIRKRTSAYSLAIGMRLVHEAPEKREPGA